MKKIILLIGIIFLAACSSVKTYDEINYKDLNNMLKNKNDFVLFIGSSKCSHCKEYEVSLNKIIGEYNLDIKYIDITKLSEEQYSELTSKIPISGTPTTVFIEDGEEKDTYNRIVGSVKYSKILEKLKDNNYVKDW